MAVVDELIALLGFRIQGEGNLKRFTKGMNDAEQAARRSATAAERQSKRFGAMSESYNALAVAGKRALGAFAVGSLVKDTVGTAISLEKALIAVQKAYDLDDTGLKEIKNEIFAMSSALGKMPEDIASIYTVGGKASIAREQIKGFTEDIAKFSAAWDTAVGETADNANVIQTIFKMDRSGLQATAGAINAIADGMAGPVTEGGLLNFLRRSAEAGKRLGLSAKDVTAFGGAMTSLGISVEQAATAFTSGLAAKLESATSLPKKAQGAFEDLGTTAKAVQEDVRGRGFAAVIDFLQKLNALKDKGGIANEIFGLENAPEILTLAGNIEALLKARALTTDDGKNVAALDKGYSLAARSTSGQIEKTQANIAIAQDQVANAYLPGINSGLERMNQLLKEGSGLFENIASGAKGFKEAIDDVGAIMDEVKKAEKAGSSFPVLEGVKNAFMAKSEETRRKAAESPNGRVAAAFDAFSTNTGQPKRVIDPQKAARSVVMAGVVTGPSAAPAPGPSVALDISKLLEPAAQAKAVLADLSTSVTARADLDISQFLSKVEQAKAAAQSLRNISAGVGASAAPTPARVVGSGAAP